MFFRAGNLTYGEPAQLLDVSKFFITSQQYLSLPEKGCTFPFLSPFLARAYGLVAISPRKHVCEQSSSGTMLANHPSTQTIAHIYLLFFGDCHTCHIFRKQTNKHSLAYPDPPFFSFAQPPCRDCFFVSSTHYFYTSSPTLSLSKQLAKHFPDQKKDQRKKVHIYTPCPNHT